MQPPELLHTSEVQALLSSQSTALPPVQEPPLQASPVVQASPSSQASVLLTGVGQPLAGTHAPSVVHGFPSLHTTAVPVQEPAAHASPVVQALPSSQELLLLTFTQPLAGSQKSVVQALLSSQLTALPPVQTPVGPHVVPVVHALPSSQAVVGGSAG